MNNPVLDTLTAFEFYQSVSHRLPAVDSVSTDASGLAENLIELEAHFDAAVFDAFGVLNVGYTASLSDLRNMGKKLIVLTNGASRTAAATQQKFIDYGFDFDAVEVVSSRYAAECAIARDSKYWSQKTLWGAITGGGSAIGDLQVEAIALDSSDANFAAVDAFLFLGSATWNPDLQHKLLASLVQNPRPLVVANPDIVAPRESGYSLEPGYFAHQILNSLAAKGIEIPTFFFGKPYRDVYTEVSRRLGAEITPRRIVMLGDTLHTDVLGANSQGWQSVLVTQHGLFRGHDVRPFIRQSRIRPDWIIPSIEKHI